MAAEQPTKTYRGNCHCGAFVYEADLPEIKGSVTCSCSMCSKKGSRILYTAPKNIRFVKGDESVLTEYRFNAKFITHMFCPHCGSSPIASGGEGDNKLYGLNANCIQGLDLPALKDTFEDGASRDEKHVPPTYTGPEPKADIDGAKIYHGSCQCGAVGIAVKCKDLHDPETANPVSCGCSVCSRNGNIWIRPTEEQVAFQGRDNLSHYVCNDRLTSKTFCKKCGVIMSAEWLEMSQEQLDALPEEMRKFREENRDQVLVNVRVFDNFSMDGLVVDRIPGDHGKPYVNP